MDEYLKPARFLISDNKTIGGGVNSFSFMLGYYQLFNFLDLENLPEEKKNIIIEKLERGAPALVSHYVIIKDLFYKGEEFKQ